MKPNPMLELAFDMVKPEDQGEWAKNVLRLIANKNVPDFDEIMRDQNREATVLALTAILMSKTKEKKSEPGSRPDQRREPEPQNQSQEPAASDSTTAKLSDGSTIEIPKPADRPDEHPERH